MSWFDYWGDIVLLTKPLCYQLNQVLMSWYDYWGDKSKLKYLCREVLFMSCFILIPIFELKAVAASRQRDCEKGEEGTVGFTPPFEEYNCILAEYCYINHFVYSFICSFVNNNTRPDRSALLSFCNVQNIIHTNNEQIEKGFTSFYLPFEFNMKSFYTNEGEHNLVPSPTLLVHAIKTEKCEEPQQPTSNLLGQYLYKIVQEPLQEPL